MEILILILKIIGIGLLVLLGIFLFLILSVVFIPVRYRIRGKGEIPDNIEADAVFSWFCHLIHGKIKYGTDGVDYKIRIFGIPLNLGKQRKESSFSEVPENEENAENRDFSGKEHFKEESFKDEESQENGECSENGRFIESEESSIDGEFIEREETPEEPEAEIELESEKSQQQNDTVSTKTHRRKKFNIKSKIENLKRKIIQLKEQLGNIKNILSEETNRNCVAFLFQEFKYLMKHYSPRKASGELQFGTDDPAKTGQILGGISIFPFWYRYKISVIPDFMAEKFYMRGNLSVKGHVRCVHLLRSGIRIIKNKDIRRLIKQIRK